MTVPTDRVVHLSTVHHDLDNRIVNKECRALGEAGFDVHLVISSTADHCVGAVQVHAIRRRSRLQRLFLSQWQAWAKLAELRPRLLHVHDPELIPLAIAWGRLHRCKVVYDAHENLVEQVAGKPYLGRATRGLARGYAHLLLALADRHCDGIVTATEGIAQVFSRTRRGRPRPVVAVQNLPWLVDFDVTHPEANDKVAVYTGDLSAERGVDKMVRAVSAIPGATLLLAGRALVDAPALRGEVERVTYRGLVPPGELPDIIATGRVGLIFLERLPNYENSLPTKVFEYMASGLPFLATDFPRWRELFGGFGAGVFVDTDDPDATREALEQLLDDPQHCADLGARGRRAVEDHFSFEPQAEVLVDFTTTLLQEDR